MTAGTLFTLIYGALLVLFLLWGFILYSVIYRKYRKRKLLLIEDTFADILSRHLYGNGTEEISYIEIQRTFRKIKITEDYPENVQYLIDLMIRTQRSFLGKNHDRIRTLYDQIPPYKASFKKTQNKHWYVRARGVREIYEMNQTQYAPYIARFRNDPNVFIRREAQIALVVFLGWESLRFLPFLTKRIELWQQIKIVEKLHDLFPEPKLEYLMDMDKISNDDGRELIMRIIRKYEIQEKSDYIIDNLTAETFNLRETAIYCLSSFRLNSVQLSQVKELFPELDNLQQQKQVLNLIVKSSEVDDVPFYLNLLETSHDLLKLNVAEILWNKGYVEEVKQFYLQQYEYEPVSSEI